VMRGDQLLARRLREERHQGRFEHRCVEPHDVVLPDQAPGGIGIGGHDHAPADAQRRPEPHQPDAVDRLVARQVDAVSRRQDGDLVPLLDEFFGDPLNMNGHSGAVRQVILQRHQHLQRQIAVLLRWLFGHNLSSRLAVQAWGKLGVALRRARAHALGRLHDFAQANIFHPQPD